TKLSGAGIATHVRFNIYPDGGVSRLRLFGRSVREKSGLRSIKRFNHLPKKQARRAVLDCCGSTHWAEQMLDRAPFSDLVHVLDTGDKIWADLAEADWLEAFRHHPAIGASRAEKTQSSAAKRWSRDEQSAAKNSHPQTLE